MPVDGFVLKNLLSPEECRMLIRAAEAREFHASGVRECFAGNRLRATIKEHSWAKQIFVRLAEYVKPRSLTASDSCDFSGDILEVPRGQYIPVGVNELFRFSKYGPGKEFKVHTDTCYARNHSYVGLMTLLIYLNDDFEGGETVVYDSEENKHVIKPETGMALAFYHTECHAGNMVRSGVKYVVRTEIVYSHAEGLGVR